MSSNLVAVVIKKTGDDGCLKTVYMYSSILMLLVTMGSASVITLFNFTLATSQCLKLGSILVMWSWTSVKSASVGPDLSLITVDMTVVLLSLLLQEEVILCQNFH